MYSTHSVVIVCMVLGTTKYPHAHSSKKLPFEADRFDPTRISYIRITSYFITVCYDYFGQRMY